MRYCKKCILPDTRPGLKITPSGVCSACVNHDKKERIDWDRRKKELSRIIEWAKKRKRGYDCIVPVSGGKDSTWQIVKCLEYKLHILAVTWKSPGRNELGEKNLDNLIRLGVDHIDYSINPEVEKKIMLKALQKTGSIAVPMHMAIYGIPLNIAVKFDIPLVVWGESPNMEYKGIGDDKELDVEWAKRHGILQGTTAADWIDEELTRKDLEPYFLPDRKGLKTRGIRSIFLGYYIKWDPEESLRIAKRYGFKARKEGPKTGYYDYADIDDDFISIHHYLKWYKFGFTRLFDNLSIEIRNHRLSRQEAIRILRREGEQAPYEDIDKFCSFMGISRRAFFQIIEKFRNPAIWIKEKGYWKIRDFLIRDWAWR